jgi:hypothetical protein
MDMTMPSETSTVRCPGCAAIVLPGAAWCGLCLQPIHTTPDPGAFGPAASPFDASHGAFSKTAAKPAADLFSESRWRSGTLTFGPVGRVVLTTGVFLPYPFFLLNLPFGLVGVVVWTAIVPRALRDIWQRDRRHHLPPQD